MVIALISDSLLCKSHAVIMYETNCSIVGDELIEGTEPYDFVLSDTCKRVFSKTLSVILDTCSTRCSGISFGGLSSVGRFMECSPLIRSPEASMDVVDELISHSFAETFFSARRGGP